MTAYRVQERVMKKQSAAAGHNRPDVCDWQQGDEKKSEKYIKKEGKKENTVPKTFGLCIIVSKDKDLLMSCIEAEISYSYLNSLYQWSK